MSQPALAEIETPGQQVAVYSPFRQQLVEIKQHNFKMVFDLSDPKGNKECRSHIYKLRQTKAAIEAARKKEKQASLEYGRQVDSEAKELTSEIEEMIEIHDKPLREFEEVEERRVTGIKKRIADMSITAEFIIDKTAAELRARYDETKAIDVETGFDEFADEAKATRLVVLDYLTGAIANAEKRESEAAELMRLREEAEARRKADEEAAAKAAAEKAEKERLEHEEQERKAQAEREEREKKEREEAERVAAEAERARIERERAEAAEAERKRVEAEAAERERKLKEEAEASRKAAEEAEARRVREAQEAEDRRAREAEESKRREDQAREDERQRMQREVDAKAVEDAKREADKEHRRKIHQDIVAAIVALEKGVKPEQAKAIVVAICGDLIPNIKIIY